MVQGLYLHVYSFSEVKKFDFIQPRRSLQCPQKPTTGPYHEPIKSSTHTHASFLLRLILISSHLCPSGIFL